MSIGRVREGDSGVYRARRVHTEKTVAVRSYCNSYGDARCAVSQRGARCRHAAPPTYHDFDFVRRDEYAPEFIVWSCESSSTQRTGSGIIFVARGGDERGICAEVGAAHGGSSRDLKPRNLLVAPADDFETRACGWRLSN